MATEAEKVEKWRLRVDHTCDSHKLRDAALAKLAQLKKSEAGKLTIDHVVIEPGDIGAAVDAVRVTWSRQVFTIVVGFHKGYSLVGVQVPKTLAMFRRIFESKIHEEIRALAASCGGAVTSISDVPVSS